MKSGNDRASKRLKERDFKLITLLEVSSAINNIESEPELFERFRDILISKLGLGQGVLVSNINGWSVNLQFGEIPEFNVGKLIEECFDFSRITVLNDVEDSQLLSVFDVIIPIYHKSEALSYLLLGDFEGEKIEVSPIIRHLPFIQTLTNLIVVAQENKRLFDENIKQAAMQKELELASKMQNMLIPDSKPERTDLDIFAMYKPHQIVGGDYYDYFAISDHETVFCMADVSGKGISAAILMSNFQAMMHAILAYDHDLEKLAISLNERVLNNVKGEKFITSFIAVYDHNNRHLTYINSGHQPALLLSGKKVDELTEGSTVLGAFKILPHLNIGNIRIEKNSKLICFTDGICEIENHQMEQFGTDRLKVIMEKAQSETVKEIVENIMFDINEFCGSTDYPDDLALLGIHFK